MRTLRGTCDFGLTADEPDELVSEEYHRRVIRGGKRCPICNVPIDKDAKTCHPCAMKLRKARNLVRQTMELVRPDQVRARLEARLAARSSEQD
ncbi:MAG: hypothetical protein JW934_16435 [Anaerolineae bacterium]|nr:hypothetical protein [Anaerolineae bacterium]